MISTKVLEEYYNILSKTEYQTISGESAPINAVRFLKLKDNLIQYSNSHIRTEVEKNLLIIETNRRYEYLNSIINRLDHILKTEKENLSIFNDSTSSSYVYYLKCLNLKEESISQVLDYIKNLLGPQETTVVFEYPTHIFTNQEAFDWFLHAMDELNMYKANSQTLARGNQAKFSSIFNNVNCRNYIFTYNIKLKEYIQFLNSDFNVNIKNDNKLSSGIMHDEKVKKLILLHISNLTLKE